MYNDNYETLLLEVSITNELLEEQNIKIDNLSNTVLILLFSVLFLKASNLIYRFIIRCLKT